MRRKPSIFVRSLLSFLVLLLVAVGIGSISYVVTISDIKKEQVGDLQESIEHTADLFGLRLAELKALIAQLAENELTKTITGTTAPLQPSDYYHLYRFSQYFPQFIWTNSFISELVVYYSSADVIATSEQVTARPKLFYDNAVDSTLLAFHEWTEAVQSSGLGGRLMPARDIWLDDESDKSLAYCLSIRNPFSRLPRGAFLALIDEHALEDIFSGVPAGEGGWHSIQTSDGMPLYTTKTQVTESEAGITVTAVAGPSNLRFTAFAPSESFLKPLRSFVRLYSITAGTIVLLGVALAAALSYLNILPMRRLIRGLKDRTDFRAVDRQNEYDFLEEAFSEIVTRNSSLQSSVREHARLLEHAFLEKVMRGHYANTQALLEDLGHFERLRTTLRGKVFRTVLVRVNGYRSVDTTEEIQELGVVRALVIRALEKYAPSDSSILNLSHDRIAVIVVGPEHKAGDGCEFAEKVFVEMNAGYGVTLNFAIGRECAELIDLALSHLGASSALDRGSYSPGKFVVRYDEVEIGESEFHYSVEDEAKLTQAILIGAREQAFSLVSRGFWKMLEDGREEGLPLFLSGIKITLLRVQSRLKLRSETAEEFGEILNSFEWNESLEDALDSAESAIGLLCDHVEGRKKSHNSEAIDRAVDYLNASYGNSTLNMNHMASQLGLTEKYLSRLFREQRGMSFSKYLEDVRLCAAESLMRDPALTIAEIADKTGYSTLSTFYRAFKKRHGVSPKHFQEEIGGPTG